MRVLSRRLASLAAILTATFILLLSPVPAHASDVDLQIPQLSQPVHGIAGNVLLEFGLIICALGLAFGMIIYNRLKNMPVHRSMLEVSELIYETCKTYMITQLKFIIKLWVFIMLVLVVYFGFLAKDANGNHLGALKVSIIVLFSLIGIFGSYGVSWFGIRINTFANSRAAFGSLAGKPFPVYAIPLQARKPSTSQLRIHSAMQCRACSRHP